MEFLEQSLLDIDIEIPSVFYGLFMATEIAYQSYIYANIMAEDYQRVTGLLKAARLAGKLCSGLISQLLVSFEFMDFMQLNYITFISLCLVTLTSIKLPSGQKRLIARSDGAELSLNGDQESLPNKVKTFSIRFRKHFNQFFGNKTLQVLSVFWVINLAMYLQIGTYSQSLWQEVAKETNVHIYNGLVDAISKAVGILASLLATVIKIDFERKGSILIIFLWFVQGSLLVITSYTTLLHINYVCSIIYSVIYQFLITILTSEIAKCILGDSYGLIFSTNTFLSLTLQMILISSVVKNSFLAHLTIRSHFFLYGAIHFFLTFAIFFIIIGSKICNYLKKSAKNTIDKKQSIKYTFNASSCVIETDIF